MSLGMLIGVNPRSLHAWKPLINKTLSFSARSYNLLRRGGALLLLDASKLRGQNRLSISLFFSTMDMKKISCAVIVAAASMSAVMAADAPAPTPGLSPSSAPALGPALEINVATSTLPVLGSLVGASLVSFFAYYLQ
ncbi:hypothetical protein V6N12_008219 [Hibiscus sabdariffa]|uniref:Arabinogalactan peptide 23-like n=1 Tax=Hibiscus sabdariffa TaxID=183260 RepID=A0ABR1ZP04_9ROSI